MSPLFRVPTQMEDLALFTRHVAGAMGARVLALVLVTWPSQNQNTMESACFSTLPLAPGFSRGVTGCLMMSALQRASCSWL